MQRYTIHVDGYPNGREAQYLTEPQFNALLDYLDLPHDERELVSPAVLCSRLNYGFRDRYTLAGENFDERGLDGVWNRLDEIQDRASELGRFVTWTTWDDAESPAPGTFAHTARFLAASGLMTGDEADAWKNEMKEGSLR